MITLSLFIILLCCAIEFLVVAGLIKLICVAFGLVFSWKIALGIWAIISILQMIFKPRKSGN